jgi:hypothetical protein
MLYECDICDNVFDSADEWQTHMITHDHTLISGQYDAGNLGHIVTMSKSASVSSEDSETDSLILSTGTPAPISGLVFKEENSQSIKLSSLSGHSDEQGVQVPAWSLNNYAEPSSFTEQWIVAQQADGEAPPLRIEDSIYHKCGTCPSTFTTWVQCEKHMKHRLHWICQSSNCDRKFDSWNNASAHMTAKKHWGADADPRTPPSVYYRTLNAPNFWPCETCPIWFTSKELAEMHMNDKQHWTDQQAQVNPVDQTDAFKGRIFRAQSWACACNRTFGSASAAKAHEVATEHVGKIRVVQGFCCCKCNQFFHTKARCIKHIIKTHPQNTVKTFNCELCSDIFSTRTGLDIHHNQKHAHKQSLSKTTRAVTQGLNITTRAVPANSTEPKAKKEPFKCETCDATFRLEVAAEQHMATKKHHPRRTQNLQNSLGGQSYPCDTCPRSFHSEEAVEQHMASTRHRKPVIPSRPTKKAYNHASAFTRGNFTSTPGLK